MRNAAWEIGLHKEATTVHLCIMDLMKYTSQILSHISLILRLLNYVHYYL